MQSVLPSQVEFSCLSVPDFQNVESVDAVEHEVFSRSGSSHSTKGQAFAEQDANQTAESAAYILTLQVAVQSAACQSEDKEESSTRINVESRFDPERILHVTVPPTRFFRTFWRSVALRLLNHAET